MLTTLLAPLWLAPPCAQAQDGGEDSPEFLLGDIGVRLDLGRAWRMTRWSDWDFKAEGQFGRDKLLLFVWSTPVQVPIADPADGWGPTYTAKIEELAGTEPNIDSIVVETVGARSAAQVTASFTFGEGGPKGVMIGSTVEANGQDMHMAVVGPSKIAKKARKELDAAVAALDYQKEPEKLAWGAAVEASGISTTLPTGWRTPLESELSQLGGVISKLGIEDIEDCWTAIRPRAGGKLDTMVTCQGGLLLGVVDEHSFPAVDPIVREKMFGTSVEVPPAEMVQLADRVGFVYSPNETLAVGVVPYDQGVARTWVVGDGEDLGAAAKATVMGSTYSGAHPAGFGDMASYWLMHRTTSPVVLCPLGGIVCVGGALGLGILGLLMRGSRRNKYADFDDD